MSIPKNQPKGFSFTTAAYSYIQSNMSDVIKYLLCLSPKPTERFLVYNGGLYSILDQLRRTAWPEGAMVRQKL